MFSPPFRMLNVIFVVQSSVSYCTNNPRRNVFLWLLIQIISLKGFFVEFRSWIMIACSLNLHRMESFIKRCALQNIVVGRNYWWLACSHRLYTNNVDEQIHIINHIFLLLIIEIGGRVLQLETFQHCLNG